MTSLTQPLPQKLFVPNQILFKRRDKLPLSGQMRWRIHEGFVRIITWDEEGYTIPTSFWGPGSLIGAELVLIQPHEIECITSVTAERVSPAAQLPATALVDQTHQALTLLRILHSRHVGYRLLQFICWLTERFGAPVPGGRMLPLKITHQELADAIGTTRVTTTRFLKQFELDGLLQWSGKSRVIYAATLQRIKL
ncbi:MAG: Crp/Fnr family transcriptional regulator [Leptolyngbya sp. SIO4C1]|nr:Crp/Fnr family transcriptional regulator [Leptolyngbya sp. SIO4C1]